MARARFECAKCGATVTVEARNCKEADRLAAYRTKTGAVCSTCYAAQREQDHKNAVQTAKRAAQTAGLLELEGSEKACAWAEQVRAEIIMALDRALIITGMCISMERVNALTDEQHEAMLANLDQTLPGHTEQDHKLAHGLMSLLEEHSVCAAAVEFVKGQASASWWIDHRFVLIAGQFKPFVQEIKPRAVEILKSKADKAMPAEVAKLAAAAQEEAILLPPGERAVPMPVEIIISGGDAPEVKAMLPIKHEAFIELMHEYGLVWKAPYWCRKINLLTSGAPEHRAAELASCLLAGGYPVRAIDQTVRDLVVSGSYEPERTRWITALVGGRHSGKFCIQWRRPDDLYEDARSIRGARWEAELKAVVAPAGSADEVEEFANEYGFAFTPGASALVEAHRKAMAAGQVVEPKIPASMKAVQSIGKRLPELVPGALSIDPSLLDE